MLFFIVVVCFLTLSQATNLDLHDAEEGIEKRFNSLPAWPTPKGDVQVSTTTKVQAGATFDGGMKRYKGVGDGGQGESQPAMFQLEDGAVLQNVILGAPAGDGVHCKGSCQIINVWWEDVGEDAATFKGTSSSQTMTVNGGGARSASDKVFQHNGPGTFIIKNFQVSNFGKLYRACGNCADSFARHVVIDNVMATGPGKSIVGINSNFGDTARITNLLMVNDGSKKIAICDKYKGVGKGSEPSKIGTGPDGSNCKYSNSDVTYSSNAPPSSSNPNPPPSSNPRPPSSNPKPPSPSPRPPSSNPNPPSSSPSSGGCSGVKYTSSPNEWWVSVSAPGASSVSIKCSGSSNLLKCNSVGGQFHCNLNNNNKGCKRPHHAIVNGKDCNLDSARATDSDGVEEIQDDSETNDMDLEDEWDSIPGWAIGLFVVGSLSLFTLFVILAMVLRTSKMETV